MIFEVTILGSNSAIPANGRHPTAQVLNVHDRLFLIDCGEGTQMRFAENNVKHGKIEHIFISHLHGDHYYGLTGLLTSYHLNRRKKPLTIIGPPGLEEIINVNFKFSRTELSYPLHYVTTTGQSGQVVLETDFLRVTTLEMFHRIPCTGFVFQERHPYRNIDKAALERYNIPFEAIPEIRKGADYTLEDGTVVPNNEITLEPPPLRKYVFMTDTAYNQPALKHAKSADLLYHEATFDKDREERARETYHSTTHQAATFAKKAGVKKLIVGHFSARYLSLEPILKETRSIFSESELAIEGRTFTIPREEA